MFHNLRALFLRSLPLPAHRPTPPDRWYCHQDYGVNINPFDCQQAVDNNWPSGNSPIHYSTVDPSPSNSVRIPKTNKFGTCTVSLETAGPDFPPPDYHIAPDKLRGLAGFLIETCAGSSDGIGGFVTFGFEAALNYVASSDNNYVEDVLDLASGIMADGNFLTIAISGNDEYEFQPGDTDPSIATYLSNYAANLSLHPDLNGFPRRQNFVDEARRLRFRAMDMIRGGHISWWFDIDMGDSSESASNEDEMDDTASSTPPTNSPNEMGKEKMTYLCDSELGSPLAVDCEKLAWSGLKSPDAVETLKPETPNIYISGSCALGISSPVATTITWAHLLAAFHTLNTLCVQNPVKDVKGGRAYYGTQNVDSWINGKRDSIGGANGSDALPIGINATIWKHHVAGNIDTECEWRLAMERKDISGCERK